MKRFLKVIDCTQQLQVRENVVGFEKALGAVKVIKDQIQYKSQSLLNLARDYFSRPKTGLSVNNKQKIRQAVVKISKGGGVFRVFPRQFTHGGICPPIWGDKCMGTKR